MPEQIRPSKFNVHPSSVAVILVLIYLLLRRMESSMFKVLLASIGLFLCTFATIAAEPLHALLITGGCCHDYQAQKKILSEGISARANVTWTILHEGDADGKDHKFSIYEKPDWA